MNSEKDRVYVQHILECINKIEIYTANDREIFMRDNLAQDGFCDGCKRWQNQLNGYQMI